MFTINDFLDDLFATERFVQLPVFSFLIARKGRCCLPRHLMELSSSGCGGAFHNYELNQNDNSKSFSYM